MAERLKAGGLTKSFDLFKNPFFILGVEPTASVAEIAEAFDDALADHAVSETLLVEAREALVNPRQRTAAELSFFFDTRSKEVELIYAALKKNESSAELVRLAYRLAPLSKANLLAYVTEHEPPTADLLFALVDAHASIDPDTVYAKLETTRRAAGFVVPSLESVKEQLHELLALHAKVALSGIRSARASVGSVEECIRRALQIVGAASTRASVCESHLQRCLVPLPLDRRAFRYFENAKLFPDALDRSNDQPLPAISNCARGLKWRVVCTTIRFRGSLLLSWSYLLPRLVFSSADTTDPVAADGFYTRAGNWLRENTRNKKKFDILFNENITYGYRRNLYALKWPALALNVLIVIGSAAYLLYPWTQVASVNVLPVFVIAFLHAVYLAIFSTRAAVEEASRIYARQLLLSTESAELRKTAAAPKSRAKKAEGPSNLRTRHGSS